VLRDFLSGDGGARTGPHACVEDNSRPRRLHGARFDARPPSAQAHSSIIAPLQRFSRGSRSFRCSHVASRLGSPPLTLRSLGPARERTPSPTGPSTVRVEGGLGWTSFGFSAFYSSCLTSLPFQPPSTSTSPVPQQSQPVQRLSIPVRQFCFGHPSFAQVRQSPTGTASTHAPPAPVCPAESASLDIISANSFPTANRSVSSWAILP
jgi:hypothetical protein